MNFVYFSTFFYIIIIYIRTYRYWLLQVLIISLCFLKFFFRFVCSAEPHSYVMEFIFISGCQCISYILMYYFLDVEYMLCRLFRMFSLCVISFNIRFYVYGSYDNVCVMQVLYLCEKYILATGY